MDWDKTDAPIEALLIVATEPISEQEMAEVLDRPIDQIQASLARLKSFYDQTERAFELRPVAGGWRYYSRPEYADVIAHSMIEGHNAKLTQASLETLAVIAFLQPISRGRIAGVRGVNVDGVVRTLISRELVKELPREEGSAAALLVTSELFLEKMGLNGLDELPPLAPNLPDASALDEELARLATAS
ncbi:MAG: SMC-Scp complex subunit ScpB [Propionibacteriaceae bacterium]|jgi:segregation and condensation protein B|nr:SMC-Scp complex subunit ScpB [Propionibacteriaceae bacterium]